MFMTMGIGTIYFFTSTISDWHPLLFSDKLKQEIINSLEYLSDKNLINVYGFVIMPNHMHLIMEIVAMNGKEMPQASLLKYTSHQFKKIVPETELELYKVVSHSREYQFWKKNSLAIELYSREILEQKLDYIHRNPVQGKWNLCDDYTAYPYSSVALYETGKSNFNFLQHYMDRI